MEIDLPIIFCSDHKYLRQHRLGYQTAELATFSASWWSCSFISLSLPYHFSAHFHGTKFMRENGEKRQPHRTTNYYYYLIILSYMCRTSDKVLLQSAAATRSSLALEVGVKGFHYKQLSRFCHIMANAMYAIIKKRHWRQTAKKWESLKLILYLRRFIFNQPILAFAYVHMRIRFFLSCSAGRYLIKARKKC